MNSRLPRLTAVLVLIGAGALIALRDQSGPADSDAVNIAAPVANGAVQATQAQPSDDQPTVGDKLLLQAAAQLERRESVSARLRHQVYVGGDQLHGVGSYWQQGTGEELRVRMELQIVGQAASLLQVSNSRILWIDRQLPTGRNVFRVNLGKLHADPVLSDSSLGDLEPGKASWTSVDPEVIAHCGGLPSLLAALGKNFTFLPPQAMRLASQSAAETQPASIPVFAVVGHWKKEELKSLLTNQSESGEAHGTNQLQRLPDRLPQEVLLLVGQADLFPYRIEYRRLETPSVASVDAPPIPYQLSTNPMVVMELMDVAFDVPIAAGQFDYAPGDAEWVDQTAAILERLRRERQEQVAVHSGPEGVVQPPR